MQLTVKVLVFRWYRCFPFLAYEKVVFYCTLFFSGSLSPNSKIPVNSSVISVCDKYMYLFMYVYTILY